MFMTREKIGHCSYFNTKMYLEHHNKDIKIAIFIATFEFTQ